MLEHILVKDPLMNSHVVADDVLDALGDAFPYCRIDVEPHAEGFRTIRVQDVGAAADRPANPQEWRYIGAIMQVVLERRAYEAGVQS